MSVSNEFNKRIISASVHGVLYSTLLMHLMLIPYVHAAPAGGQVVGGTGSISQTGTQTTINQTTQNMAIDWQSYNVNSNERVQYIQPNTSSISLNRILSNNGSTIAGNISANGQVILVNPNGIVFTPTATINVGGIIASGLDIKPSDFMNGNYIFNEVLGTDGGVINSGMINASLGGNVALIGRHVENNGLISANLGTVNLAAGKEAVLTFDNAGLLGVRISKEILQSELGVDPAVLNSGTIQAEGGKVLLTASVSQDVFSQAVNTSSIQPATSVVVNADGTYTLGGGADVVNTGTIDTSTTNAAENVGRIVLLGNNVTSSGTLKADAANGNGGEIELHSSNMTLLTQNSLTSARSESNGNGGIVKVLGDKVGLFDQATVDVSGANGGGQALIGGDVHGANTNIRNASETIVQPGASIYADALQNGNGGKVIAWADGNTSFIGSIFTRGGVTGGNGGFTETSGKLNLFFDGVVDSSASNGSKGTLLLDPQFIKVVTNTTPNDNGQLRIINFGDGGNAGSTFTITTDCTNTACTNGLNAALNNNNVLLEANTDISFANNVSVVSNSTSNLTLHAGRSITMGTGSSISLAGGDFTAKINDENASNASGARSSGLAQFSMGAGSSISTHGGIVNIYTGTYDNSGGNLVLNTISTTGDAATTNNAAGGDAGTITLRSGNITDGTNAITLNGDLAADGGAGLGTGIQGSANAILLDAPIINVNGVRKISADSSSTGAVNAITIRYEDAGGTSLQNNLNLTGIAGGIGSLELIAGSGTNVNLQSSVNYNGSGLYGNLKISAGKDISLVGNIVDLNTASVDRLAITLNANSDLAGGGNVTVLDWTGGTNQTINTVGGVFDVSGVNYFGSSASGNKFNVVTGAGNATINMTGYAQLGDMNVGGNLSVTAGAATNGVSISQGTAGTSNDILTVAANHTAIFNSTGAGAIVLTNNNNLQGTIGLKTTGAYDASLTNTAANTILGDSTAATPIVVSTGQDLFVNATQQLTISGAVSAARDTNITFASDNTPDSLFLFNSGSITSGGAVAISSGNGGNTYNINGTIHSDSTAPNSVVMNGGTNNDTFNIQVAPTIVAGGSIVLNGGATATNTGNDTFNLVTLFTGQVNGGDGTDTVTGPDAAVNIANNWQISSAGGGTLSQINTPSGIPANTGTVTFAGIENLTGGTGVDNFKFITVTTPTTTNGSLSGLLNGGNTGTGAQPIDTVDLTGLAPAMTVQLFAAVPGTQLTNTAGNLGIFQVESVSSNAATASKLISPSSTANAWILAGTNSLTYGTAQLDFANFATIEGGSTVTANPVGTPLSVTNPGEKFTISTATSTNINTGNSSFTKVTVDPGMSMGTLTTGSGTNTVDISGSVNSISGTANNGSNHITVYSGGSVTNTILTGNGADAIVVNGTVGSISTGAGSDSVTLASPASITLAGQSALTPGVSMGAPASSQTVTGDTLTVNSSATTWSITSSGVDGKDGTVADGASTLYFTGVDNFNNPNSTSSILDFSGVTTGSVDVNLNNTSGFATVIGSNSVLSTLTGVNGTTNYWVIGQLPASVNNGTSITATNNDGLNDGVVAYGTSTVTAINFINFNHLVGGSSATGPATNYFYLAGSTTPTLPNSVVLTNGPTNGVFAPSTGFTNALNGVLTGGTGTSTANTLTGRDLPSVWTISNTSDNSSGVNSLGGQVVYNTTLSGASAAANYATGFSGMQKLVGGVNNDHFIYTAIPLANSTAVIDGGSQVAAANNFDIVDFSSISTSNLIAVQIGSTQYGNIEGFIGNSTTTVNSSRLTGLNGVENIWTLLNALSYTTAGTSTNPANAAFAPTGLNNSGTLAANGNTYQFMNFSNLAGATNAGASNTFDFSNATITAGATTGLITGTIAGGASGASFTVANTIIGRNAASTWLINATNGGTVRDTTTTNQDVIYVNNFSGIQNLTGGNAADNFIVGIHASINPNDVITTPGSIQNINGGSTPAATAYNTITGRDAANTWTITGTNSGTVGLTQIAGSPVAYVNSFSNIQNLTGGSSTDIFTFNSATVGYIPITPTDIFLTLTGGGIINGTIDGGSGSNVLIGRDVAATTLFNTPYGQFNANGLNSWIISGNNSGSVTEQQNANPPIILGLFGITFVNSTATKYVNAFSNIQTLTGGTGVDSFNVSSGASIGTLNGGAGNNGFTINGVVTTLNTNGVSGALDGSNSIYVNSIGTGVNASVGTINAGTGNDSITVNPASGLGVATVSSITDTGGTNSITINTGGSSGAISTGSGTDTITVKGTVTGAINTGDGADTLNVSGTVTGLINGGVNTTGVDTFNVTGTTARTVQLGGITNASANYVISNFENVSANPAGSTLVGDSISGGASNTWTINTTDSTITGGATNVTFNGFANLTGGTGADTFKFSPYTSIAGTINGGDATASNNFIDYSLYNTSSIIDLAGISVAANALNVVTTTLSTNGSPTTVTTVATGYSNIQGVTGNNDGTAITVANNSNFNGAVNPTNYWSINSTNGGCVSTTTGCTAGTTAAVQFRNFNNLTGNQNSVDNFTINGSGIMTGSVTGNGGTDSITGKNTASYWSLNTMNDPLNPNSVSLNADGSLPYVEFVNIPYLFGGTGGNTFNFYLSPQTTGFATINGGGLASNNTVDITHVAGNADVPLAMFTNIGIFNGNNNGDGTNSYIDNLIGRDTAATTWIINARNSGCVNLGGSTTCTGSSITFNNFNYLTGVTIPASANGSNTFILNNQVSNSTTGSLSGLITGGGKANLVVNTDVTTSVLVYDPAPTAYVYDLPGTIAVTNMGGGTTGNFQTSCTGICSYTITGVNTYTLAGSTYTQSYINASAGSDNTFIWQSGGSLDGYILGGTGANTLVIAAFPLIASVAATVQLQVGSTAIVTNSGYTAATNTYHLGINNIQTVIGNTANNNQLIAPNTVQTNVWDIHSVNFAGIGPTNLYAGTYGNNSGTLSVGGNVLTFMNVQNLQGGTGVDNFTLAANGALTGILDGGTNPAPGTQPIDTLDIVPSNSTIQLGGLANATATLRVDHIESITADANPTSTNTIYGSSGPLTWYVTGVNSGQVSDGVTNPQVDFSNFNTIYGSTGNDTFNVVRTPAITNTNLAISGVIHANGGTDTLYVSLAGNETGSVNFLSDNGATTTVHLMDGAGNPGTYVGDYRASALQINGINYDQFSYIDGANAYTINFSGAATITDELTAAQLTLHGTAVNDPIHLSAGTTSPSGLNFAINTNNPVDVSNKQSIIIDAPNSVINQDTLLALPDTSSLTLRGRQVVQTNHDRLGVGTLIFDNVGTDLGSATPGQEFMTNVVNLSLLNTGAAYINELDAINLTNSNTINAVNITATSIGSGATNHLTGPLTMAAVGGAITLNNDTATNLAGITADSLTIVSLGSITDSGPINVTSVNLNSTGDVTLLQLNGLGNATTSPGSITANNIRLVTANGIGTIDPVTTTGAGQFLSTTTTGTLNVTNTSSGVINIHNTGDIQRLDLKNNGNIGFANTGNTVIGVIDANGGNGYDKANAPYAGNVYLSGTGSLTAPIADFRIKPDVVAQNLYTNNFSSIGTFGRPISLRVENAFVVVNTPPNLVNVFYYGGFPLISPNNINVFTGLEGLSLQLLQLESLGEVDPAIFTQVKNYYYEDVALLMPEDQRYGDDEVKSNKKPCDSGANTDKKTECDKPTGAIQ